MRNEESVGRQVVQREQVIVIPMSAQCWCVLDDGSVSGPYRVVASATLLTLEEVVGETTRGRRRIGSKDVECIESDYPMEPDEVRHSMDSADVRFLLIPDDAAQWESLWTEQKYVCFSELAAKALSETRVTLACENARESAKDVVEKGEGRR